MYSNLQVLITLVVSIAESVMQWSGVRPSVPSAYSLSLTNEQHATRPANTLNRQRTIRRFYIIVCHVLMLIFSAICVLDMRTSIAY